MTHEQQPGDNHVSILLVVYDLKHVMFRPCPYELNIVSFPNSCVKALTPKCVGMFGDGAFGR